MTGRVSRAAFYRWRRQGAGPAVVRLPGGGVRVRLRALTAWLRRLEQEDTQHGQEQTVDGQRYDIRFWDIKKIGNGTAARYRVRWAVNGREHCKSFMARRWPTGSSPELKDAVRDRRPFDPITGLPEAEVTEDEAVTWYAHAAPTPRPSGRTWPRSRAGRSPRPWSPSPSP